MAKDAGSFDQALLAKPQDGSTDVGDQLAWQRFVSIHGKGALNRDLAVILGRSVDEIDRAKKALGGASSGAASLRKAGGFDALFELWHGRPPADDEWPVPTFYERRGSYEWLPPEVALLATLVGQMSPSKWLKFSLRAFGRSRTTKRRNETAWPCKTRSLAWA